MRDRLLRVLREDRWRLVLVCLTVNASILAGIGLRNPEYLSDFRLNDSPDARHYVQLGRNLLLEGHYSRTEGPPFSPDFLRTPVYPILAGALDIVTGPTGIYLAQVAIQAGVVLLLYHLAGIYFGAGAAFWVGLLAATDLMSATYIHSALEETTEMLERCGFGNVRRLDGADDTSYAQDRVRSDKHGEEKFGTGELRLFCELIRK